MVSQVVRRCENEGKKKGEIKVGKDNIYKRRDGDHGRRAGVR
jgi:hypothetical protein